MGTTPSKPRSRDETSRTELDAPLEPAPLNVAYRTSEEMNRCKSTSGLRGRMGEFRRLKAISPNAFAKAVAEYRENTGDGYGSEDRGGDIHEDSGDGKQPGRYSSRKDSKDYHERSARDRPSTGPQVGKEE